MTIAGRKTPSRTDGGIVHAGPPPGSWRYQKAALWRFSAECTSTPANGGSCPGSTTWKTKGRGLKPVELSPPPGSWRAQYTAMAVPSTPATRCYAEQHGRSPGVLMKGGGSKPARFQANKQLEGRSCVAPSGPTAAIRPPCHSILTIATSWMGSGPVSEGTRTTSSMGQMQTYGNSSVGPGPSHHLPGSRRTRLKRN